MIVEAHSPIGLMSKRNQGKVFGSKVEESDSKASSGSWEEDDEYIAFDVSIEEGVDCDNDVDVTCEEVNGEKALVVFKNGVRGHNNFHQIYKNNC